MQPCFSFLVWVFIAYWRHLEPFVVFKLFRVTHKMPLSLNVEDFSEQLQHFMFLMVMKKNESLVSFAQNKHRGIFKGIYRSWFEYLISDIFSGLL